MPARRRQPHRCLAVRQRRYPANHYRRWAGAAEREVPAHTVGSGESACQPWRVMAHDVRRAEGFNLADNVPDVGRRDHRLGQERHSESTAYSSSPWLIAKLRARLRSRHHIVGHHRARASSRSTPPRGSLDGGAGPRHPPAGALYAWLHGAVAPAPAPWRRLAPAGVRARLGALAAVVWRTGTPGRCASR